jgi:hypothetical protein
MDADEFFVAFTASMHKWHAHWNTRSPIRIPFLRGFMLMKLKVHDEVALHLMQRQILTYSCSSLEYWAVQPYLKEQVNLRLQFGHVWTRVIGLHVPL